MDDLEGQNDERLEGLAAKVKLLKDVSNPQPVVCVGFRGRLNVRLCQISVGIGNEVKNSVPDLDTLVCVHTNLSGFYEGLNSRFSK